MFISGEKTLTDVVKGIRASKRDVSVYISQCISEIKNEISSNDMYIKSNALQKLTFLQMMGYNMSYASFATIEVMSSTKFAQKRIGYLAASQGFKQDTEVILLSTNLLQKELRKACGTGGSMYGVYEAGLAINCLSNIITEDLARDILPSLVLLTNHHQAYLRKKSILCLYKLFIKYPQGLRLTFNKIQEALSDSNTSVVSCAVNLITELSDKNPTNYLHLAPQFFKLLTNSSNNWMLIKVVKLLGSLVPEEPRLARKLLEPLSDIVRNTEAKSLLYEALRTITLCLPYCTKNDGTVPSNVPEIINLCATMLLEKFLKEKDQNLKYLGLVGFNTLIQQSTTNTTTSTTSTTQSSSSSAALLLLSSNSTGLLYRPIMLQCLSDDDTTIRTRALDLVPYMVSRKNLIELVQQLLIHIDVATSTYKINLVIKVLEICTSDKYSNLQDFSWYLDVLFQLGYMNDISTSVGSILCSLVTDVAVRVLPVRPYAVRRSIEMLLDNNNSIDSSLSSSSTTSTTATGGVTKQIMSQIIPSLSWIVGEYSDLIHESASIDPEEGFIEFTYNNYSVGTYHSIIQCLTDPIRNSNTPAESSLKKTTVQKINIQSAVKVFAAAINDTNVSVQELDSILHTLQQNLPIFVQSVDVEVMERSYTLLFFLQSLKLFDSNIASSSSSSSLIQMENATSKQQEESKNGDLLGMSDPLDALSSVTTKAVASNGSSKPTRTTGTSSTTKQQYADILKFVLKPSPMKPVGTKTQRKKRNSPNGGGCGGGTIGGSTITIDVIEAPINISIFDSLITKEEEATTSLVGHTRTLQSVTFTQQKSNKVSNKSSDNVNVSGNRIVSSGSTSSLTSAMLTNDTGSIPASRRQNDPFYLSSSTAFGGQNIGGDSDGQQQRDTMPSRFGAIHLADSDEEDVNNDTTGNKIKRKKKSKKLKKNDQSNSNGDEMLLPNSTSNNNYVVYDADDDDLLVIQQQQQKSSYTKPINKKKHGKEFEGLARVDLLSPLRDDEVMPERKHHVVTARTNSSVQQSQPVGATTTANKKDKKDSKKAKKKSSKNNKSNVDQDLLDLGDFGSAMSTTTTVAATVANNSTDKNAGNNRINSAFDDLLGLSSTPPTPLLPMSISANSAIASQNAPNAGTVSSMSDPMMSFLSMPNNTTTQQKADKKSKVKKPWLNATIKSSNETIWSLFSIQYRPHRTIVGNSIAATVTVRIKNESAIPIHNVSITFPGMSTMTFPSIDPGSNVESEKVGPFSYLALDTSQDVKGTVTVNNGTTTSSSPLKMVIPVSYHFTAETNMTLEGIAQELVGPGWFSASTKIDILFMKDPIEIKNILCTFLRAAEVDGSTSTLSPATGTYAARTGTGERIRVLVKIKEMTTVKVDIKCTNETIGKLLLSDIKRIIV